MTLLILIKHNGLLIVSIYIIKDMVLKCIKEHFHLGVCHRFYDKKYILYICGISFLWFWVD